MSNMIERVARALWDETGPSNSGWTFEMDRDDMVTLARAAIEAMRSPSAKMLDAGMTAIEDCKDESWSSGAEGESHTYEYVSSAAHLVTWQAMIDAALKTEDRP